MVEAPLCLAPIEVQWGQGKLAKLTRPDDVIEEGRFFNVQCRENSEITMAGKPFSRALQL